MNQEIKQEWIEALRSGKYTQIKGRLKTEEGHCCLGVLCELYPEEQFVKLNMFRYSIIGVEKYLPISISRWADIDPDKANQLAVFNDEGKTFLELADYIEKTL